MIVMGREAGKTKVNMRGTVKENLKE